MELIKLTDKVSKKVESWKDIKQIVPEFISWVDENNGKINGMYDTGYAFSHTQVSDDPFAFFVVAKEWTRGGAPEDAPYDQLFRSRIIVNPRIVSVPENTLQVRERLNPATNKTEKHKVAVKNKIHIEEGCMSFPYRKAKKIDRFFEVKVAYSVPRNILGFTFLMPVKETVKGLKAHIFQHECDHMAGRNMYYGDRVK